MGLDINIYKPLSYKNEVISDLDLDSFFVIDENKDMSLFNKYLFKKENGYYNMHKAIIESGHNVDDVTSRCDEYIDGKYVCHFTTKSDVSFSASPELYYEIDTCILYKEIGRQRKGENKKFYDDGKWDNKIITQEKVLLSDWKLYFSQSEEDKANFKKNIIDKFVEGKTFVIYH